MVYTPINPSFGGNPFNSSHLIGIANAQNNFKDPKSTTSNSKEDIFARQLQYRLLSDIWSQITDAIFGVNTQESGTLSCEIGRASCRERVVRYELIEGVGCQVNKKK